MYCNSTKKCQTFISYAYGVVKLVYLKHMKKYMNCINFFKFCKNSYMIGKFLNMGEFVFHLDYAMFEGL
jgi:hypothetical protein